MVSFIIVNFNGEKYIERCISSVLALKVEKEIIVVDNGSTDRSRDLINKFNVKKVFLKKNSGYPSGVNKGIKNSRGDTIFLLTPTTFLDNSIETLLKDIEDVDAVAPTLVDDKGNTIQSIRRIPTYRDFIFLLTGISTLFKNSPFFNRWKYPDFDYTKRQIVPQPMSCCILIKKDVLSELGGFDEDFFLYFSDVDFFKRFGQKGFKCLFEPDVKAIHIRGGITRNIGEKRLEHFHRDMIIYLRKHLKLWQLPAFMSVLVFGIRKLHHRIKKWMKRN